VLLNRSSPAVTAPTLTTDSRTGFETLARHLYALGHRRLAYVGGPDGVADENRLRGLADFEQSVEGVTITRVKGGAGSESGLAAVDAVMQTDATGVLAFNDLVAIGLVHGLTERGINVPDDISVTGFDDIPFARFMSPSLTTASVPHEVLGVLAWARMRTLIEGETPEHDVVFQPRLEARRSTAAPRSAGRHLVK
jgi:LacI family transcriptional regulator